MGMTWGCIPFMYNLEEGTYKLYKLGAVGPGCKRRSQPAMTTRAACSCIQETPGKPPIWGRVRLGLAAQRDLGR